MHTSDKTQKEIVAVFDRDRHLSNDPIHLVACISKSMFGNPAFRVFTTGGFAVVLAVLVMNKRLTVDFHDGELEPFKKIFKALPDQR